MKGKRGMGKGNKGSSQCTFPFAHSPFPFTLYPFVLSPLTLFTIYHLLFTRLLTYHLSPLYDLSR